MKSMLENITGNLIEELSKERLSLNDLWVLEQLQMGKKDFPVHLMQRVERRGFCEGGNLTEQGLTYYSKCTGINLARNLSDADKLDSLIKSLGPAMERAAQIDYAEMFNEWWKSFPANDSFSYKGNNYGGSRALRTSKDKCKEKYISILKSGIYTHSQMLNALQVEIAQKKEKTFQTGKNALTYMPASMTYLNQQVYEGFIDSTMTQEKETQLVDPNNLF